jgi:hypothetical protein
MVGSNLFIGLIAGGISIFSFVLILRQAQGLPPNPSFFERLKRAIMVGVGFLVFFISGVVSIDYISSPSIAKNWNIRAILALLCYTIPVFLITLLGSFVWFSRSDATRQFFSRRLKNINQNSKKKK